MKPLKRLATTERISQRADLRVSGQSRIVNRQFNPHIRIYSLSLPNGKSHNGVGRCDFKPACSHRILNSCTCSKSPRIQTAPGFHSAHPLTAGARAGARRDPSEPPQLAAIPAQAAGKPMETPKIACSAARHQPHCACVHSLLLLSNCKLKILTEISRLFCWKIMCLRFWTCCSLGFGVGGPARLSRKFPQ